MSKREKRQRRDGVYINVRSETDGYPAYSLPYGTKNRRNKKKKLTRAKHVLPNVNRTQAAERPKMLFLSLVTLTVDLETYPSEGLNTSSV